MRPLLLWTGRLRWLHESPCSSQRDKAERGTRLDRGVNQIEGNGIRARVLGVRKAQPKGCRRGAHVGGSMRRENIKGVRANTRDGMHGMMGAVKGGCASVRGGATVPLRCRSRGRAGRRAEAASVFVLASRVLCAGHIEQLVSCVRLVHTRLAILARVSISRRSPRSFLPRACCILHVSSVLVR